MKRVTGIGGIFFKAKENANELKKWYSDHLGITEDQPGYGTNWKWRNYDQPENTGEIIFSLFSSDSDYLKPSDSPFMINFRVEDLEQLLLVLKAEGVEQVGQMEVYEYGKFAWILDPDGNKIELWEPKKGYEFDGGLPAS